MPFRTPLIAAFAATAVLAVGAPAASASTAPINHFSIPTAFARFQGWPIGMIGASSVVGTAASGACGSATANQVQGRTGTTAQVCGGLSLIGPAIGQISTVIGPTIISPAVVGSAIVTGNNIVVGP